MSKISWTHPKLDIVIEMYYEPGTRDEPPYVEIEAIYAGGVTPTDNIDNLFNHDQIIDDFWFHRPDLEAL